MRRRVGREEVGIVVGKGEEEVGCVRDRQGSKRRMRRGGVSGLSEG